MIGSLPSNNPPMPLIFQVLIFGGTLPYTYYWTLPGGATSEQQSASYTFNTLGTYAVQVNVVDRTGLTGLAIANVYVNEDLSGDFGL